jgi:LysR family glycine cleavage system transcriptional activator
MSRLPSAHLLLALIATSRHGSVARAAQALSLTPGAVSKQLLELERRLEVPLFERVRKRLLLTDAGQRYVERVAPLLAELEQATLDLVIHGSPRSTDAVQLHLSMLPTFGAKWLIPRLADFHTKHPHIELRFVRHADGYDFSLPTLDCAIRYGRGVWPEAQADYLAGHEVVLVGSLRDVAKLRTPADVLKLPRLHHTTEPRGWQRWCELHGVPTAQVLDGPQMDQVSSLIRAAIAGMGLALVPHCLVEEELASGAVAKANFPTFLQKTGYFLCCPQLKARLPQLEAFRGWLLAQARAASVESSASER